MSSSWEAAARVARRTGFGASGPVVDAVQREGVQHYVRRVIRADPAKDRGARSTPAPTFEILRPQSSRMSQAERAAHDHAVQKQNSALTNWWLQRMAAVDNPFREKLTFCWHNHFATSVHKVRSAALMIKQNERQRALGTGDFRTFAYAMLTDGALLRFLDGQKNTAKAPNENLAREFMEIFTLGHGDAYTEEDVRQGARALSGLTVHPDGKVVLRAKQHDTGTKTILGVTGDLGPKGYAEAVLARKGGARYIVTRLWGQLVSNTPPAGDVLDRLVEAYGSSYDLAALLEAMFTDPAFAAAQGSFIIGPLEWVMGAVRAVRPDLTARGAYADLGHVLNGLGQLPFYPPSVGGWASGRAWLSTAAAEVRLRAAEQMAAKADLSALDGSAPSRIDAVAHLLGVSSWSDRSVAALRPAANNPGQLVAIALNTPEYLVH